MVYYFYAPIEEGGAYCCAYVGRLVGMSVGLLLFVQGKNQEPFVLEASDMVGRLSFM